MTENYEMEFNDETHAMVFHRIIPHKKRTTEEALKFIEQQIQKTHK